MDPNPDVKHQNKIAQVEEHTVPGFDFKITVVRVTDSAVGLIYDCQNDRVLLIRQKRVAMERPDNESGEIVECVGGRIDKPGGPKAIFVDEAKDEAGVNITEDHVHWLNGGEPMALSAGILTERCYLAFIEVACEAFDEGDEGYGLEHEGEKIDRVWMSTKHFLGTFVHECLRTWALAQYLQARLQRREIARLEQQVLDLNEEVERSFDRDSTDR